MSAILFGAGAFTALLASVSGLPDGEAMRTGLLLFFLGYYRGFAIC